MKTEYKIRVRERLFDGKYTPSFDARPDKIVPIDEDYREITEGSLTDLAKAIVEDYKQRDPKRICLTAEGESRYTFYNDDGHFSRPPTAEEMKQLGEEVLKALKGR